MLDIIFSTFRRRSVFFSGVMVFKFLTRDDFYINSTPCLFFALPAFLDSPENKMFKGFYDLDFVDFINIDQLFAEN